MATPSSMGDRRVNDDFQTPRADDSVASGAKNDGDVVSETLSREREEQTMRADVKTVAVKRTMDELRMIAKDVDADAWMFRAPRSNP